MSSATPGPTITLNLTENQIDLLRTLHGWPSKFPIHANELSAIERTRVDRLRCLGLIRKRVLRLTEKGEEYLAKAEGREGLTRGQLPFNQFLKLKTAHDVRKLEGCAHCEQLGHRDNMVFGFPYANSYYHGRCFVAAHGFDALVHVNPDCLSLADLGLDLMTKFLEARDVHLP